MKTFTIKRICILGFLLAIMIVIKYILGFIPGIELISSLFVIFAIILPILDLTLLIICFNILVLVVYGFGTWWLVYWIIWPIDVLVSKLIFKCTKKIFFISLWGFFAGFLVFFWYFLSDLLIFGLNYAMLNVITAIPINLIEGFTTMIFILLFGRRICNIFNIYKPVFWPDMKRIIIPKTNMKFNLSSLIIITSSASIVTLFMINNVFISLKNNLIHNEDKPGMIYDSNGDKIINKYISIDHQNSLHYLNSKYYNKIYTQLNNHQIAIAVIADNKVIYDKITISNNVNKLYNVMIKSKKIEFEYGKYPLLGYAVYEYRKIGDTKWEHGISNSKMSGHYSPYIYDNHKFGSLGVSNLEIIPKSIYEFTYD